MGSINGRYLLFVSFILLLLLLLRPTSAAQCNKCCKEIGCFVNGDFSSSCDIPTILGIPTISCDSGTPCVQGKCRYCPCATSPGCSSEGYAVAASDCDNTCTFGVTVRITGPCSASSSISDITGIPVWAIVSIAVAVLLICVWNASKCCKGSGDKSYNRLP